MGTQGKLKDATFADINGTKHKLYKVRTLGRGRGFGTLNVLYNTYVTTGWKTRKEAIEILRTQTIQVVYAARSLAAIPGSERRLLRRLKRRSGANVASVVRSLRRCTATKPAIPAARRTGCTIMAKRVAHDATDTTQANAVGRGIARSATRGL